MARVSEAQKKRDSISYLRRNGYVVQEENKIRCMCCGRYKSAEQGMGNFWMSFSPLHKYNTAKIKDKEGNIVEKSFSPICRKCATNILQDGEKDDLFELLRILDRPFIRDSWQKALDKRGVTQIITVFGNYLSNIALNHKDLRFKDGEPYSIEDEKDEVFQKESKKRYNKKWRGNFTSSEIKYLDEYLDSLKDDFNIVTTSHLDYAKKIAKASLVMDREYEKIIDGDGSDASYEKYKKIFDDLSKSAQFAESGRGKSAVGNGISEITETVENRQWIYKREEFEEDDIDLLLKQFGNINKSL